MNPSIPLPDYNFPQNYFTHAHGHRQHYIDAGNGTPMLMLHGNPSWSYYFRRVINALKDHHRCVVPDHLGMGLSDKPQHGYDYHLSQRVDDLDALMTHLINEGAPVKGWTLIVHDWGGMIGMAYACRYPERIARLVIMNTGAFPNPKALRLPLALKLVRDTWMGSFLVRHFNAFAWGAAQFGVVRRLDPAVQTALLAPYDTAENRIGTLKFVQDIPLTSADRGFDLVRSTGEQLSQFSDRPALIFWGMKDFVFDATFLEVWRQKLLQSEVHQYPDAGHYVLEDAHERIIPALLAFIERTEAAASQVH